MSIVKCIYCKKPINKSTDEYREVTSRRYAHLTCFASKSEIEENLNKEIMEYCKEVFGPLANYGLIGKQINKYIKDGKTKQGILLSLKFWYGVKKNGIEKSNGGIGIVPYIYEDAKRYWTKVVPKTTGKIEEEVDYIKPKKRKTLLEKLLEEE